MSADLLQNKKIEDLTPKSYSQKATSVTLSALRTPKCSSVILHTSGTNGQRNVHIRAPQPSDLKNASERAAQPSDGATEKASEFLHKQNAFLLLASQGLAFAVQGSETRPVVAGTAYLLVLTALVHRNDPHRLVNIQTTLKLKKNIKMFNIEPATLLHIAKHVNAIVAGLDGVSSLDMRFAPEAEYETLLHAYAAYILEGLPVSDEIHNYCPQLKRFSKHMVIVAVAIHGMMGGNFGFDQSCSFLQEFHPSSGYGSPAMFNDRLLDVYDKIACLFECRPQDYESALDFARGTQRPREVMKSQELAGYLAWVDACGFKAPTDRVPTQETIKGFYEKHLTSTTPKESTSERATGKPISLVLHTGPSTPANSADKNAATNALNAFCKKHEIFDDNRTKLWGLMCKKQLTVRTGAPFDEAKVRACCDDLKIVLKD